MKYYTLGDAAKATGLSKTTIFKAIKSGKLSYVDKTSEGYQIEPSELNRVFPLLTDKPLQNTITKNDRAQQNNTGLQAEITLLREMLQREKENNDYLKEQQQFLQDQLKRTTLVLEGRSSNSETTRGEQATKQRSWLGRIFKAS